MKRIEKKMEMGCLFLFILFLHRTEQAKNVDPNKFNCSIWSPVEPGVNSTGSPSIPLTHIFCGQIKPNTTPPEAEGFHALPNGNSPNSARIKDNVKVISKSNNAISCCEKPCSVQVRNRRDLSNEWVTKQSSDRQCFFRENIYDTVTRIQNVYTRCKIGDITEKEVCVKHYYANTGNDEYYLQFLLGEKRNVVSAYPVNTKSSLKCKRLFDYITNCPPIPSRGRMNN